MPRRIVPMNDELGFKHYQNNRELATEILKSKKSILIETTQLGNQLFRNGNRFILIDPHRIQVLYYLKWKQKYYNLLKTTVSQEIIHWRDRGIFETRNLTSHVYLDLLLPINNVIMSDFLHTNPAERFWLKLVDEAFDREFGVYSLNFNRQQLIHLTSKLDFNSLLISKDEKTSKNPWGNKVKFEAHRIIISKIHLTQTTI